MSKPTEQSSLREYIAWDRTTRWFHWINVVCVIGLAAIGTVLLSDDALGIKGNSKVLLKTVHVYIGYCFAINLAWRIAWAFFDGKQSGWRSLLPFRHGYVSELVSYVKGMASGEEPGYVGHNPLGRLMVAFLLLLMLLQAATGLVLAGTDLYKPPFGSIIATWVTNGDVEKLNNLLPGSKEFVDQAAYDQMRSFRKPIEKTHQYVFYLLVIAVVFHILGVVVTEIRERSGLISAMITGRKVFAEPPVDSHDRKDRGD